MDCSTQAELGSREHIERIAARARADRVPLAGAFDLTYRCNYRCVHCYAGHLVAQKRSQARELETEQVIELLCQVADAGCLLLLLSGGEPLLREDFTQIYTRAKELGLIVTVFTNASMVEQRHLDAFAEYPPHQLEVSVYGASEAVYETVSGIPGSFRHARRGIERLIEQGVRVALKTMILRDNVEEIDAIEALAESLGVGFRLDPLVSPRLDGDCGPLTQRVDPERAAEVELASEKRRSYLANLLERGTTVAAREPESESRLYRCSAGVSAFHVDPRGFVRPCLMSREFAYTASVTGFADAWSKAGAAIDQATWNGIGGCTGCPNMLVCGYCPGLFALEKASPSRPPEYLCCLGENRRRVVSQKRAEVENVAAR